MALRLKQPFHYFDSFLFYKSFAFSTHSSFCVLVCKLELFQLTLLSDPPFPHPTLSWIEYIAIDQMSHRSQNSGFGSFYETWLLNVDSDCSECDSQKMRTKLAHKKNGQHLFFRLAIVINVWCRVLNAEQQFFHVWQLCLVCVCVCVEKRGNTLKTIAISFCMSITNSDRQWHNYLRINSVHLTTCI